MFYLTNIFVLVIFIYFIISFCNCKLIPQENEINDECLKNIFVKFNRLFIIDPHNQLQYNFMQHETIYLTKTDDMNKYGLIYDFKHFLIYIETEDDLKNILQQLYKHPGWKSKYYHFISIKHTNINTTRIFQVLWKKHIYNAIILILQEHHSFTYFPFANCTCNNINPVYLGNCSKIQQYFPEKIPNNLQQCEYRFLALIRPPFVINNNVTTIDNPKRQGFEVTLMHNIIRKLNITYKNIYHNYRDWGVRQSNGTFTEMFGLLQNKRADIMYGGFHHGFIPSRYFDLTISYKIVNNAWFVPSPLQIPKWQNVLIVFETNVWIILLITYIIKTIYWCFVLKKPIDHCFLYIWSVFLLISVKPPKSFILKIQFIVCTISFMIITTAYVSKLFGVLTKPILEKPIRSIDEIIERNLKIGFHPAYENRINDSKYQYLLDNYIRCSFGFECLNRTAFQRDMAVIKLDVQTFYMIPRVYTTPSGRPMLNWFNEIIGHSQIGFYTLKGLPILDKINNIMYKYIESGLIDKWEEDMKHVTRKDISEDLKAISLYHLQTPFYILLFGVVISSFVFLFEYIIHFDKM